MLYAIIFEGRSGPRLTDSGQLYRASGDAWTEKGFIHTADLVLSVTTMAIQEHPHEQLVFELAEQYHSILEDSPQAVFIYLDDYHKVCNQKFSDLLDYASPEDWAEMKTPVTDSTEDTRDNLINGVMGAIQEKTASSFRVSWKARNGSRVDTICVSVPGAYRGQIYAILFFEV